MNGVRTGGWVKTEEDPPELLEGTKAINHLEEVVVGAGGAVLLRLCARHDTGVLTYSPLAGRWLSGRWRKDSDVPTPSPARQRLAHRYGLSLPVNQRKLEAADALGQLAEETGLSLIEMAIAFVLNHPAVTSAIIGHGERRATPHHILGLRTT